MRHLHSQVPQAHAHVAAHSQTAAHNIRVSALGAGGRISSNPRHPNGTSSGTTRSLMATLEIKDGALGAGGGVPSSPKNPRSAGDGAI